MWSESYPCIGSRAIRMAKKFSRTKVRPMSHHRCLETYNQGAIVFYLFLFNRPISECRATYLRVHWPRVIGHFLSHVTEVTCDISSH
ncbi:hypothetical protein [Heliothis virescens ascovirus 3j]|uniref:Uncharacterized protein n=1 Tax=Heliothis virescens ascovirus 3j TaxID=1561067 RepID=A0A2Z5UZG5_9VIRU|nr:hypothetical protein [Heliothis virescens ascovirus 3j]